MEWLQLETNRTPKNEEIGLNGEIALETPRTPLFTYT